MAVTQEDLRKATQIRLRLETLDGGDDGNTTLAANPTDRLLEELQLIASQAHLGEVEDIAEAMDLLSEFARKFELLDEVLNAGLPFPAEWMRARK